MLIKKHILWAKIQDLGEQFPVHSEEIITTCILNIWRNCVNV